MRSATPARRGSARELPTIPTRRRGPSAPPRRRVPGSRRRSAAGRSRGRRPLPSGRRRSARAACRAARRGSARSCRPPRRSCADRRPRRLSRRRWRHRRRCRPAGGSPRPLRRPARAARRRPRAAIGVRPSGWWRSRGHDSERTPPTRASIRKERAVRYHLFRIVQRPRRQCDTAHPSSLISSRVENRAPVAPPLRVTHDDERHSAGARCFEDCSGQGDAVLPIRAGAPADRHAHLSTAASFPELMLVTDGVPEHGHPAASSPSTR